MKFLKLVLQGLSYYWRTHLGVVLGVWVSTAVLVGALLVGDSVRESLKDIALARLGNIKIAVSSGDRFFQAQLAEDLKKDLLSEVVAVLALRGTAVTPTGDSRAGEVQLLGIDSGFQDLSLHPPALNFPSAGSVILNARLARQLNVKKGDTIIIRVEEPSALPKDAPLSTDADSLTALRLKVQEVAPDSSLGRFSLRANQIPPYNAFVPLDWLQKKINLSKKANMLLAGHSESESPELDAANQVLRRHIRLDDVSLELRYLEQQKTFEIRSPRVFIDPPLANAIEKAFPDSTKILTYFVNEFRFENSSTPYSMVSALDQESLKIEKDEILISQWLVDDLNVKVGDKIQLRYFIIGPMRTLEERMSEFQVRDILPMNDPQLDPDLMPEFPGLSNADQCRDWEPGFPIDLDKIRPKDEDYWDQYRGTPKALICLETAQELWENRFGDLTAIRISRPDNHQGSVEEKILQEIDPASIGLYFLPVREQAKAATNQSQDFSSLFIGLSFFLIVSALLLTSLLFKLGIEQRSEEVGILLAIGYTPRRVFLLFLAEGFFLSLLGTLLGAFSGFLYTRVVLYGLSTVWVGAVHSSSLSFHFKPSTLIMGVLISLIVSLITIGLSLRRLSKVQAHQLLSAKKETDLSLPAGSHVSPWVISLSGLLAAILVYFAMGKEGQEAAGFFFGAGASLLIFAISLVHWILYRLSCSTKEQSFSITTLGIRTTTRRRGRSLATVALLACGSFLVVSVGANRHDPMEQSRERSSGTGGFAFYARSALPVYQDLNSEEGLEKYGLSRQALSGVEFVPLKVREGDDASCLNLNRSQTPPLLGVDPQLLDDRGSFNFVKKLDQAKVKHPWQLLNAVDDIRIVPAVGDQATLVWGLGKSVGDTLDYQDERGRAFKVRIVGMIANSILQGNLLISEEQFNQRFPSESGYRLFLFDAPENLHKEISVDISGTLSQGFQNIGLELTPAGQRLAEFNTVENTYLSIFQLLGGLGLILGSAGLGAIVLRNVLERRGELALLEALGFEKRSIHRLVLLEHGFLLILGLICGVITGLVAVLPSLLSPGADVPYRSLALTLLLIGASGWIWIWIATVVALQGSLISMLRNE